MTFDDDATIPMQPLSPAAPPTPPTWPTEPPQPTRAPSGPAAPKRATGFWRGCGLTLAFAGVFLVGMALSAILMALIFLPPLAPAASSPSPNALVKVTITDAFLNKALANSAAGTLTNAQSHITADGKITISGVLQGVPVESGQTAVIVLEPSVSNGALTVTAVSGSVDGVPLPDYALSPITSNVNSQLGQTNVMSFGNGQQLTVKGVSFADGAMTIIYA